MIAGVEKGGPAVELRDRDGSKRTAEVTLGRLPVNS